MDKNKQLKVVDLFCGCGGLSFGFMQAGFDILLGIDNDNAAINTYIQNHKHSQALCQDITKVSYKNEIKRIIGDNPIDVVIGGPPCQGMSLSGPRLLSDPRNDLYLTFIRLVKEIQPRAFLMENVPGLVGLFHGQIREAIIENFSKMGYKVSWRILCASNFGVPQKRKRVIFIGLKEKEFDFPQIEESLISCEMALSDLPSLEEDIGIEENVYASEPKNLYQVLMRENSNKVRNHIAARHSKKVQQIISLVPDGGNYKNLPEELKRSRRFNVAWTRFDSEKPAPTIDTGHRHHFHYKYNRVPTVRECARLQSFPDDFLFLGNKTQQFRQVGNAVPPLMVQKLAEHLSKYLIKQTDEICNP